MKEYDKRIVLQLLIRFTTFRLVIELKCDTIYNVFNRIRSLRFSRRNYIPEDNNFYPGGY